MYEPSGHLSRRAFTVRQLSQRKRISSLLRIWYSFIVIFRAQCRNRTCQCKHCHLKGLYTFIYRDEWEPQDLFLIPSKSNNLAFFEWSTCGSKVDALSNDGHVWLFEGISGDVPLLICHQHLLCSRFTHGTYSIGRISVE